MLSMSSFRVNMTLKKAQVRGIIINQMGRLEANTFYKTKVWSQRKSLLNSKLKSNSNSSKGKSQSNLRRKRRAYRKKNAVTLNLSTKVTKSLLSKLKTPFKLIISSFNLFYVRLLGRAFALTIVQLRFIRT